MTEADLRETYLRWLRRAMPALLLPFLLTAVLQLAMASPLWDLQVPPGAAARYLFIGIAAATAVVGRDTRNRELEDRPLAPAALVSLSWRLLAHALAPAVIGLVLAFMTRQPWDYYFLLCGTLAALVFLFPRYEQWAEWSMRPGQGAGPEHDA